MVQYCVLDCPLQPIANRYNKDWDDWFQRAFSRNNIPTAHIRPWMWERAIHDPSQFCDSYDMLEWKTKQVQSLIEQIEKTKDIFERFVVFLQDGWCPGLEALFWLRDVEKVDIKICAYWHGGSYLGSDILNEHKCERWSSGAEWNWLSQCSKIFVGSNYHKALMHKSELFKNWEGWFHVVGCPVQVPGLSMSKFNDNRENIVVWPHRPSPGKHPKAFDSIAAEFKDSGWQFVKSHEVCKNRSEYFELLGSAKIAVSTAQHETFGISMVEAALMGCWPVVPERLSYPEIFGDDFTYDSLEEAVEKIRGYMGNVTNFYFDPDVYRQDCVTDHICNLIKEVGEA